MIAPGPNLSLKTPEGNALALAHALDLWNATRGTPMQREWQAPASLKPYLRHLYEQHNEELVIEPVEQPVWARGLDVSRCWVAYSGGKDSLAAALIAREQGYDVTLYHVDGLNRSVASAEVAAAHIGARAAGFPLVVEGVSQSGPRAGFLEVPSKNQVVVALMVARMIDVRAGTYVLGTTEADTAIAYLCGYSDTTTAAELYQVWLDAVAPGIQRRIFIRQETQSMALIAREGYLDIPCGSCFAPLRFRAHLRAKNEAKYGVLLPGRCGSCPKCCWEYLVLDAIGYDVPGNGFLVHCLRYLQGQMSAYEGRKRSLEDVYDYWVKDDLVQEHLAL